MLDSIKAGSNPTNCCWKIFRRSVIQSIAEGIANAVRSTLPRNRTQTVRRPMKRFCQRLKVRLPQRGYSCGGDCRSYSRYEVKRSDGQTVRLRLSFSTTRRPMNRPGRLASANREHPCGRGLGLGPGQKISGIMPCTVIRPGDMADRILDTALSRMEWRTNQDGLRLS